MRRFRRPAPGQLAFELPVPAITIGRNRVHRIVRPCAGCGKPVERRMTDFARSRTGRVFCGNDCRNRVGSKPRRGVFVSCAECGNDLYRQPGEATKNRTDRFFCNYKCHDAWQGRRQVERACLLCGTVRWFSPSYVANGGGRYCSREHEAIGRMSKRLDRWHNGKPVTLDSAGYVQVWEPNHPRSYKGGWYLEHRVVVERRLGRYLTGDEVVHHINGVKHDNRSENLEVMGAVEHNVLTMKELKEKRAADQAELEAYRLAYPRVSGG